MHSISWMIGLNCIVSKKCQTKQIMFHNKNSLKKLWRTLRISGMAPCAHNGALWAESSFAVNSSWRDPGYEFLFVWYTTVTQLHEIVTCNGFLKIEVLFQKLTANFRYHVEVALVYSK